MKTKRFSPRDAKLIRDNPDKDPDELLELGLSQKAYSRLQEKQDEILQPVSITKSAPAQQQKSIVAMSNMRTGRVVHIGYKAASMLSAKYPKEFKILNQ